MIIACILPATIVASINYLLDYFLRKKDWKKNTSSEKFGIILTILLSHPYVLSSLLGLLLGFDTYGPFTQIIVTLGFSIPIVNSICLLLSLILRKLEKSRLSNYILPFGIVYSGIIIGIALILG